MNIEQILTDFNSRVRHLQAVTGKSQAEIARWLEVSRTTLHYYCQGQHSPKAAALYRLAQAERQAGAVPPETSSSRGANDDPLPEEEAGTAAPVTGAPLRSEVELTRHLRWLQGARRRQEETAHAARRHLDELAAWIRETEADLAECRKQPAAGDERTVLRDIDTVSLPIFGTLPAGWPQTRDGVMQRRPLKTLRVPRGRFPEGAFGLEVRGDSMNAARPLAVCDGDTVVLLSPEQREPQPEDIVAALIDGETCLKRLKMRRRPAGAFLKSESTNPAHGEIHPAHELVIQGVFVGKL